MALGKKSISQIAFFPPGELVFPGKFTNVLGMDIDFIWPHKCSVSDEHLAEKLGVINPPGGTVPASGDSKYQHILAMTLTVFSHI